jgi:PhnB protein
MREVRPSFLERTHIMSVELNAYLFFPGNAEQAIAFYQQVFGGQVTITRRGDVDPTATPEQRNQVINALLTGGDITLRASDREDTSLDPQTRIELSLIGADEARLRNVFDALAEGGIVRDKLERQFWGDIFGAVTDKYGIGWQVNIGTAGA